jgi:hypothetical protein
MTNVVKINVLTGKKTNATEVLDDFSTPYIKNRITSAQFRQQLIIDGKDNDVLPAIESIEDEQKRKLVKVRYEFETKFNIDDPDLLMLAGAVGYETQEQIQEFFNKASLL